MPGRVLTPTPDYNRKAKPIVGIKNKRVMLGPITGCSTIYVLDHYSSSKYGFKSWCAEPTVLRQILVAAKEMVTAANKTSTSTGLGAMQFWFGGKYGTFSIYTSRRQQYWYFVSKK